MKLSGIPSLKMAENIKSAQAPPRGYDSRRRGRRSASFFFASRASATTLDVSSVTHVTRAHYRTLLQMTWRRRSGPPRGLGMRCPLIWSLVHLPRVRMRFVWPFPRFHDLLLADRSLSNVSIPYIAHVPPDKNIYRISEPPR